MAYLKGGTVVDGDLFVEGGLRVNSIKDADGNTYPHIGDNSTYVENRLLKWGEENGAIVTAHIEDAEEEEQATKTNRSIINIYGYKTLIPLVLASYTKDIITGSDLPSDTVYFNSSFNKATTSDQAYRTLTSSEKTYLVDNNIGLSPNAWAYSPAI